MFKVIVVGFLVGGIVLLSVGFASMCFGVYDWKLWLRIRRARREVTEVAHRRNSKTRVVSRQGATAISPRYLAFSILTDTDRERDLLRQDSEMYEELRGALEKAGYPQEAIPLVHFGIQSQETIDREYGGNWREAADLP